MNGVNVIKRNKFIVKTRGYSCCGWIWIQLYIIKIKNNFE